MNAHHEHEFEAAPGLPEPLPQGERLLWQGSPDFLTLAIHAFHVRKLAIYFAGMFGLQWLYLLGEPGGSVLMPLLTSAVLAYGGPGSAGAHRLVFRAHHRLHPDRPPHPHAHRHRAHAHLQPAAAQARCRRHPPASQGHGDIALTLTGEDRIAYLNLWPHARPWLLKQPQPSLRCVPDAQKIGALVLQAWTAQNTDTLAILGTTEQAPAPARQPREREIAAATA